MTDLPKFNYDWSDERKFQYSGELRVGREIPKRYRAAETENERGINWINDPHDALYIAGPVGSGKTYQAWALVKRWLMAHPRNTFQGWGTADLLHHLRPNNAKVTPARPYNFPHEARPEIVINHYQEVCSAHLLLLEDLGAENLSGWVTEQLTAIINARYNDELPTIYTSNIAPKELATHVGERIASRITHNAIVIPVIGSDRRRVQA
jgi:DNA replication protein DnaC